MKLPCDACIWSIIPMIKRELVLELFNRHKLKKTEIAEVLGITKSSVTQYIKGVRASNSNKLNKIRRIRSKIINLSKAIAQKQIKEKEIVLKFCEICKIAQKRVKI